MSNEFQRNLAFQAALADCAAADAACAQADQALVAIDRELNPEAKPGIFPGLVPEFVRVNPSRRALKAEADAAFRAVQIANRRLTREFKNEYREYREAKRAQKLAQLKTEKSED